MQPPPAPLQTSTTDQCWVGLKEAHRFEREANHVTGHHGVVFRPHKVSDAKGVPQHRVTPQQRAVLQQHINVQNRHNVSKQGTPY